MKLFEGLKKTLARWHHWEKWLSWIIFTAILLFGGWAIKEVYYPQIGRIIMGLGFILAGGLLIIGANKNLNR
jgi:Na+/phosphate symporter